MNAGAIIQKSHIANSILMERIGFGSDDNDIHQLLYNVRSFVRHNNKDFDSKAKAKHYHHQLYTFVSSSVI